MTLHDDPRLTAYALGALGEAERRAFEAELASDPAARAEVEAIRALGAELETELSESTVPLLDVEQRARLTTAAGSVPPARWWTRASVLAPIGLAASVLVVLGVLASSQSEFGGMYRNPDDEAKEAPVVYHLITPAPGTEEPDAGWLNWTEAPDASAGSAPVSNPGPGWMLASGDGAGLANPPRGAPASDREVDELEPLPEFLHTEGYDRVTDNAFVRVQAHDSSSAVSTFSIDVDTASYANVRRFLDTQGRLPPPDAVRIEELLNYFPYDYPAPPADAKHPFAASMDIAACPWEPSHQLVRIALQGKKLTAEERPAANLVFLLDVSGSMDQPNKLPLLKQAMKLLVDRLESEDRVAIVVYAGAAGLVLPSTAGAEKASILAALERLSAGGSTNGGAGIELAYRIAASNFVDGGVNRVILATDGDFNVGVSDRGSLTRLIEEKAKGGVFLTVLGFGTGNVQDGQMEDLSNRGNGNYAYVDSLREARKVLVEQGLGTLVTIAKDVKIQIFFNPAKVAGWRLIGYENRVLRREDFDDDTKDAGEIGAGHAVTALYELVPVGQDVPAPATEENPFLTPSAPAPDAAAKGPLFLRLRYKQPDGEKSTRIRADAPAGDAPQRFEDMDADFQWAAAVAGFGMLLRDSPHKGQCSWALVDEIASAARGDDEGGYRAEFLQLVRLAATLSNR